jgi:peptidyl-prolyl cis-trans isomerase D
MAALGKIRKHGVLLVTAIAIALFLFVAGDLIRGGETLFHKNQQNVAEIAGEAVSIQEYQKMFDELQDYYEIVNGTSVSGEDDLNRIKDEAWQTYVQNTLIAKECEELGITVTDAEVAEIIKNGQSQLLQVPLFMNRQSGRYDYSIVQTFLNEYKTLKEAGNVPEQYEKYYTYYMFAQKQIRNQYLTQKYQVLLSQIMLSNPVEAKQSFADRTNETEVILASLNLSKIADDKVTVTDDEINSKYKEDKEKYQQVIETRDIKYIDVAVTPSEQDKKDAEQAINESYTKLAAATTNTAAGNVCRQATSLLNFNDLLKKKDAYPQMIADLLDSTAVGTTTLPKYDAMTNTYYTFKILDKQTQADSVLYRQLAVTGTDEAASKASADSIVNALNGGASYADIAKKYNQKSDSAWISTSQYQNGNYQADDITMLKTIYSLQPNEVKSIKLTNGYNIVVQVLDRKGTVEKYNVAAIVKTLNFSDATYNTACNKFNSFLAQNNTKEKIEANAEKNGYNVLSYPDATSNSHNIAGIHGTREALKWLFDDADKGDVSQLYECGDNDHLLIVMLDEVNPKGYRPLSKVSADIKSQLVNEKKVGMLAEQLKGVKSVAEAKSKGAEVDTVNHISFANPTFVRATASSEPVVSAAASKATKGAFVGPVKGNGGAYVMQVVNKSKTSEKFDDKQEQEQNAQVYFRAVAQTAINTLYLKANVTDNRYKFF